MLFNFVIGNQISSQIRDQIIDNWNSSPLIAIYLVNDNWFDYNISNWLIDD